MTTNDLVILAPFSRGDEAPLLLVGGLAGGEPPLLLEAVEGDPLGRPGGGEPDVCAGPGGGRRGGKFSVLRNSCVQRPFLGLDRRMKSCRPYLTFVFTSPGLRPGAVLRTLACSLKALNLGWKLLGT